MATSFAVRPTRSRTDLEGLVIGHGPTLVAALAEARYLADGPVEMIRATDLSGHITVLARGLR